jgi:hypothetical protein
MGRPCTCERMEHGKPWTPAQCRVCWLYHHAPNYKALWDGAVAIAKPSTRAACTHLGAEVRTELCPSCKGKIKVKVFACPLHTECTIRKQIDGVASCGDCKDYLPLTSSSGPNQEKPCGC